MWGMYMYKERRNKVTYKIRDAKKDYFENVSYEYKNDTRIYRKELRYIIGDIGNGNQVPSSIVTYSTNI